MTVTPPQKKPGSEARTARRTFLTAIVLLPVLVALVIVIGIVWEMTRPDDWGLQQNRDAGNLTAWQSRAEADQILRDTAAAVGLDVQLWEPGTGESSCDRGNGKYDGTYYSLDDLSHDGPVDSQAVIAAVAAYWQHLGLRISAPLTQGSTPSTQVLSISALTSTGAYLEVGSDPTTVTLFTGQSGCALVGGGPTPLPSATLLPVSSGVPVPRSSTP